VRFHYPGNTVEQDFGSGAGASGAALKAQV
jgi:hypothetical protein